MNGKDLFKMASSNLRRHKSRTMLTILGIVIGTMSIILMIALGMGMQENFASSIENIGSIDIIDVSKGNNVTQTTRLSEVDAEDEITDLDIAFFRDIEHVIEVSPVISTNVKLVSDEYEASGNLYGIDMSLFEALGFKLQDGQSSDNPALINIIFGQTAAESFSEVELSAASSKSSSTNGSGNFTAGQGPSQGPSQGPGQGGGNRLFSPVTDEVASYDVDVFSDRISMSLDSSYSPMNKVASTSSVYRVEGGGILDSGDMTRDRNMYIDIDILKELLEDKNGEATTGYSNAYLQIEDTSYSDQIVAELEYYGYDTSTSADMVETIQSTTQMLQIALGAIGGIALIVAAIGITNTMIMAITERKREIGIMKVIGATIRDIKRLFLLEAAMIGFLGGGIGVGLSFAVATIIQSNSFSDAATGNAAGGGMGSIMSLNFSLPLWLIAAGVVFTTLVGLTSGYLPARKAMACSALEAIHAE